MAPRPALVDTSTTARLRISDTLRVNENPGQAGFRVPFGERVDTFVMYVTLVGDAVFATLGLLVAWWWTGTDGRDTAPFWLLASFVPALILLLSLGKLYRSDLNRRTIDDIATIEAMAALASLLFMTVMLWRQISYVGASGLKLWVCTAIAIPLARVVVMLVRRALHLNTRLAAPTLIVGNGRIAHQIVERLNASPEYGLRPIGLLDVEAPQSGNDEAPGFLIPYVGAPEHLKGVVEATGAQNIVIAFSRSRDEVLTDVIHIAHRLGLRVWVVPRMFDTIGARAHIEHIGGLPLLALAYTNPNGWQFAAKHLSDRVAAGLGLLAISPLFLTLMLLVRLSSPGPIFFGQDRVGRDGRVFKCLKFRSMRPPRASDAEFELQTGAAPGGVEGVDRRTTIGKFMRATSLDELPQLINVLRGDMSLVGPRPERPEFVELFEMQIRRYGERHRVKAGVTGWAQVHGLRGQTSIADRAEWDNYYIENWSLILDLKILALTVAAVLRGSE